MSSPPPDPLHDPPPDPLHDPPPNLPPNQFIYSEGAQGCCTAHIQLPYYLSCYFCQSLEAYVIIFGSNLTLGYATCRTCLYDISRRLRITYALLHEDNRN